MKFDKIFTGLKIATTLMSNNGKLNEDVAFNAVFDHRMSDPDSFDASLNSLYMASFKDCQYLQRYTKYRFPSGRNMLCAYLHRPSGKAKGLVIYVHGIGGSAFDWYALGQNELVRRGYMVFAIELTASGSSQGLGIPSLSQSAFDVAAAVKYVQSRRELRSFPLFLFGHSWGGYGVAASLGLCSGVAACVSISGFASPVDEMMGLPSSKLGGIPIGDGKALEDALIRRAGPDGNLSAIDSIRSSGTPVLAMHGKCDTTVPFVKVSILENSRGFSNVTTYIDDEADHVSIFFSDSARRLRVAAQEKLPEIEKVIGKNLSRLPESERRKYETELDVLGCSELNQRLFDAVDDFFAKYR